MQHVGIIGHCLRLSLWQVWAERKLRSGPKLGWSGAERWAGLRKIGRSRAWAGGRGAGTERWSEVRKIRFNAERQNLPLRSAHMLWSEGMTDRQTHMIHPLHDDCILLMIVLYEYSKFWIESNSYFGIRFETSTMIQNFRILTVTDFLLI